MTASAVPHPISDDDGVEYDSLEVWPDELRIGDIYGGFVITAIAAADHYRDRAVRLTIFTDPDSLEEGVRSEEWGRLVLRTDRSRGHKIPIDRPIQH
jgi:hypothetical protein